MSDQQAPPQYDKQESRSSLNTSHVLALHLTASGVKNFIVVLFYSSTTTPLIKAVHRTLHRYAI